MNMNFGLFQEQTLKLVMTPELRQAISILQYSALDLKNYLLEQAAENPVIELQEISAAAETPVEQKPTPEIDWKELVSNRATGDYSFANHESTYNPLDHVHAPSTSLYEHLREQLSYVKGLSGKQRRIALFLIGNLDENGYLDIATEEASRQLGVEVREVEEMLSLIQYFDPVGVAARNLQECLLLQLRHAGLDDERTVRVIEEHLDDLAYNRFSKISDKLRIGLQEVQAIADLVRSLNPRPGAAFSLAQPRFVVPDVTVEKVAGEYVVLVNESTAPRITISKFYENLLKRSDSESATRQFIQEKLNAALWLAKSIEQRRLTLLRVMQAIVEKQIDFFEHGPDRLKPMTQKEIAEQVGLHESTVSRATSNKYVQTPRGVFELKYFFTSALATANGDATSSESVKRRIKALVEAEDRSQPLSDQKLSELLAAEGIEISRRTVAKYREEMMIPSSAKRKRYA
ncbi:RNA polymerase factor sigma-54 [Brevibacillus marinus]|uniref:RNA polymerase factor sigma-54 n=1 Tax=Brevibacillus marinus TaxID=2496837 RepID=UPI000F8364B8|nr:RNA polymerase factor sigma-54 [Brevibacillus marinus]